MTDDPSLVKDVEDAILEVARRHPSLRGPWVFDEATLQAQAAAIRARRATPLPGRGR